LEFRKAQNLSPHFYLSQVKGKFQHKLSVHLHRGGKWAGGGAFEELTLPSEAKSRFTRHWMLANIYFEFMM
jgi:hypothetical protein